MTSPIAAGSDIRHTNFYSYTTKNNLVPYYTTIEDNQTIDFSEFYNNINVHANFLLIESVNSELYITLNGGQQIIYIPTGHCREISYSDICSITVHGALGTKLRWYIQTF